MKKLFIYALLFLTLGTGASAKAAVKEGNINIPITVGDENNHSNKPKAPERIPIFCQYEDGQLFFGFSYSFGGVIVNVTNKNTGEQWQAVLQTSGTASMNVSEGAGCYHIEIITIDNKVYKGEYEI